MLVTGCGSKSNEPPKAAEPSRVLQPTPDAVKPAPVVQSPDTISSPPPKTPRQPHEPLKNKRWRLYELNGAAVAMAEGFRQEPYIMLSLQTNRAKGAASCNRFGGTYSVDGERLAFSEMLTTKVNCYGAMEVEREFLRGLELVNRYRMVREDSVVFLQNSKVVMRLAALYLN